MSFEVRPIFYAFGQSGVTVTDIEPATTEFVAGESSVDATAVGESLRDDTAEFERVEVRVFERWLRRFGHWLDYWIWSGERKS